MKNTLTLCFLLSTCIISNAQHKFVEGYYVAEENDTVRGLIEIQSNWRYFTSFTFKPTIDGAPQTFTPEEAVAFGIDNGNVFREFLFNDKDGHLLDGFFNVEVDGKVSLVTHDKRYFAVNDQNQIYEVTPIPLEAAMEGQSRVRELGYLKMLMSDCEKASEEWLHKNYSVSNLKGMFITYNKCVGRSVKTFGDLKPKFSAGIQVAPAILSGNGGDAHPLDDLGRSTTVTGGVFLGLTKPSSLGEVSVILEVNLHKFENSQSFRQGLGQFGITNNEVIVKFNAITIPFYCRMGKRFFADAGIQTQFITSNSSSWRTERAGVIEFKDPEGLSPTSLGFLFGGGARFDIGSFPFRVFARYSFAGNNSASSFRIISLGTSLQLTKN